VTLPSVPVTLGPLADGAHAVTVDAADAAGNHGTASVSFTVDTIPPVIAITSPPAGTIPTAVPPLTFTVTDANPDPTKTVVRLDGSIIPQSSGSTLGPLTPGGHTLTVDATDLAGNPSPTGSVTFNVNIGPALTVTSASVFYSSVAVNLPTSPTSFTISNNGNTGFPLTITGITLSGTDTADFQLNNGNCGTLPFALPVGGSCNFNVSFAPLTTGAKSATGETPASIPLTGLGVAAISNPARSTLPTQTNYTTLTAAFTAATGNATLQAMNAVLPATTLTVNSTGTVNFSGGYDAVWGIRTGMTVMQGVMTIQRGSLVVDGLTIQ
jgi:hypothetical protein